MKTRKATKSIPVLTDSFRFLANTLNEEARTVDMVFTTSKPVRMLGFTERGLEEFNEVLSMEKGAVSLDRMNRGAPLLDSHNRYQGLKAQLGVVEKAWIAGDALHGRVRFSKRQDVEPYFQDVKDGIIRNGSLGYRVYKYQDTTKDGEATRTLTATEWEPMEMSLVTVPADSDAQVKSEQVETNEVEILFKEKGEKMEPKTKGDNVSPTDHDKIRKQEREKAAKVIRACRQAGLGDDFAEELIDKGHAYERCLEMIQEKWASQDKPEEKPEGTDIQVTRDEGDTRRAAAVEAVLHRAAPADHELTDLGKRYAHMTSLELAKSVVRDNGFQVEGRSINEIIKRAFHSTDDFTNILENVALKRLQRGYESVEQVWRQFGRETTLRDFKQTSAVKLDEAPDLESVGEGAEIKYGTMGDSKEVYALGTYAKGISVTRQTLINDDLNAFAEVAVKFGRAAAYLENDIAMNQAILSNPNMGDGNALFHNPTHANQITGDNLGDGVALKNMKAKLRKQTDTAGRPLNLRPRFLIVGPDQEYTAREELAPVSSQGGFNVHGDGSLTLLVEALITDNQAILVADPNQIESLEYAYLEGARGVQVESEQTFDVLGVKIRAYLDFASKMIEYRSMVNNPGE